MTIQYFDYSLYFALFCVFILTAIGQLIYYWFIFSNLAFYKQPDYKAAREPVSVVICAKNEYYNLKQNLPLILEQDYPDYEVVLVNDASEDETVELLKDIQRKYAHMKIVNIPQNLNFFSGKKFPLSIGIKSAKHDLLLLTDADCKPASKNWITHMASGFSGDTEIMLGYGPYRTAKGFINTLVRFDTLQVAMQYFSFALSGFPYMGVGRNLAYRKSLFYKNKGFTSHYKVNSGDDDLFINRIATKNNTKIQINPESHCFSDAPASFGAWIRQKRRHLSTGKYYKPKFKFLLGNYSLSQILFFLLFFVLLAKNYQFVLIFSIFLLRLFSQLFIVKRCLNKLNGAGSVLATPFMELLLLAVNLLLSMSNMVIKQNTWK